MKPGRGGSKWRLLETERFFVEELWRESPDGSRRERAVIRHPGAVVILPIVDNDRVCLIRNFRVAIGRVLLELPAGTLVPNEEPQRAAERELIEESGYRAGHWRPLHEFYVSPGILDERMYLFLASDLQAGPPAREPGEEIENVVVPWAEALEMIRRGEIEDAKTIIGLLLGQEYRQR